MGRYLIVANQTAESAELVGRIGAIAAEEPDAEFVLLVPATPVEHLLTWTEGEGAAVAGRRADAAKVRLETEGAKVIRTVVGDASPIQALSDEVNARPGYYDALILSTLPIGVSRWLKLDLLHHAQRMYRLPITHIVAQAEHTA